MRDEVVDNSLSSVFRFISKAHPKLYINTELHLFIPVNKSEFSQLIIIWSSIQTFTSHKEGSIKHSFLKLLAYHFDHVEWYLLVA